MQPVEIIGVFIPIIAIIGVVIMIIYLRRYENQERMAMIDKGLSPDDFKKSKEQGFGTLKFALLLMGIGLGFLMGNILGSYTDMRDNIAYFSMLFLFGGIGLIIAYVIQRKQTDKEIG
ncbi:MAG: DUF6249 domain-containing protein [Candidatus Cyclobacteriaceae bacterium M2_1C_046]